ncbi:MAG: DUF3784 domain-containing protein [Acetobacterium sp.]
MIILWIVVIIFIAMTIYLISGRGGWLIAGYNTSSSEEKINYDEKKLCRGVGIFIMIPCDLLLISLLFQDSESVILVEGIIFAVYIVTMIVVLNKTGFAKFKK